MFGMPAAMPAGGMPKDDQNDLSSSNGSDGAADMTDSLQKSRF
jgi:hypothetical protein